MRAVEQYLLSMDALYTNRRKRKAVRVALNYGARVLPALMTKLAFREPPLFERLLVDALPLPPLGAVCRNHRAETGHTLYTCRGCATTRSLQVACVSLNPSTVRRLDIRIFHTHTHTIVPECTEEENTTETENF